MKKVKNQLVSSNNGFNGAMRILLTGIRILIGWHFLYEGLAKLFASNWTSAGYLLQSQWLFSGFFHWIAESPQILNIVNMINIWGLILIGLGLFFGFLTRWASLAGFLLLLLYFIANPPFVGFVSEYTTEGHYLIVNKNLIELFMLLLLAFVPKDNFYSIDRLLSRATRKQPDETKKPKPAAIGTRRKFLQDLVSLPLFGGFAFAFLKKKQWESYEELSLISQPSRTDATTGASPVGVAFKDLSELKSKVSCAKIGDFEISRIICGGNLISGYAHSRDLVYVSSLVQSYFTDEKVLETMRLCEACGINTIVLRVDKNTLRLMKKYRRRNGKIQWIAQSKISAEDVAADIDAAVDAGAIGAYIHGGISDSLVAQGNMDLLYKGLEHIKKRNVLAGIAGHKLAVIMACEKAGFDVDFYMKTLNSANYWTAGPSLITDPNWKPNPYVEVVQEFPEGKHDNIWSETPRQTIEFMKNVKKPWIAYKVLGAGAIHPKDGFKYAFENGADFACVGMFDYQIVENANIANDIFSDDKFVTRA